MQEVIHEIITSEAAYVADLTSAIRLFHKPLEKFNVLSPADLTLVFADLPVLMEVNSQLLEVCLPVSANMCMIAHWRVYVLYVP